MTLHEVDSKLPGALADITMRCLSKDPVARFQTGHELSDALLGFPPCERAESAHRRPHARVVRQGDEEQDDERRTDGMTARPQQERRLVDVALPIPLFPEASTYAVEGATRHPLVAGSRVVRSGARRPRRRLLPRRERWRRARQHQAEGR